MNHIFINKPGNTTAIAIVVNTGSRSEDKNIKGIAHFIEHMCFKLNNDKKENQYGYKIEKYGGDINAFTDREITCYWVKIANEFIDEGLKVVQNIALNPTFPNNEINKEREVIIQELKMYKDKANAIIWDNLNETFFTKTSGLHYSVVGTEETLNFIKRKDMLNFYNKHYIDDNMTLVMIGDVKSGIRLSKKYNYNKVFYDKKNKLTKSEFYEKRDNIEQSNILIGNFIQTPRLNLIENWYKLALIDSIYSGMSGRLFDSVREKNHLVYGIKFNYDIFSDGMMGWFVSLALEENKIQKAKKLILKELKRPVTKKDIEYGINKFIGENEIEFDDNISIMESIAFSLVKYVNYNEFIYNYKENIKIASEDINNFIKKINFDDNIICGVIPK